MAPRLFKSAGSSIKSFMASPGSWLMQAGHSVTLRRSVIHSAAEETMMSAETGFQGLGKFEGLGKTEGRVKRRGIGDFVKGGAPIVGLTAYTAPIAHLLDPHVDFLLVGDSLGMVVYGFDSTLPVTVEMMIAHGAAVMRSTLRALVVVDLPFGAYQESREQAFRCAARILAETRCAAVKLEGGAE